MTLAMRRLQILVPDSNTEHAVRGAVGRTVSLAVGHFEFELIVHPGRDGGVRSSGPELLRLQRSRFSHALLIVDDEGSGSARGAIETEKELDSRLALVWGPHAKAIVVEPEIDIWMWGAESHIRDVVGWTHGVRIRSWLQSKGHEFDAKGKPIRPKEALHEVFRFCQVPRSSAQYKALATRISLKRCNDPAFLRLSETLQSWFGQRT